MPVFDTVFPADSLEFCPTAGSQNIFVCGTYKLLDQPPVPGNSTGSSKVPQKRIGQCLAFEVHSSEEGDVQFEKVHSFDLPAIPDMKWCHRSSTIPLLAVANSEGFITLHEWRERSFQEVDSIRCASSDTLCLSLDSSNRRTGGSTGSLVVSLSNGSLCLLTPSETSSLSVTETWHAHDYEPWVAAWNYWDSNVIYSGGDDLQMKGWDIRQGFDRPTFINKRFEAGVTCIQSHPHIEHLIAVGSYNETVQLFDARKMNNSVAQAEIGGGAWRVKWHPSEARKRDLLVACMHDGFKILQFDENENGGLHNPQTVKRFDEHESMAYGADWSFAPPLRDDGSIAAGCSFYDHKLSVWKV